MITKEQVQHIAKLARVQLDEEELEKFQKDFSQILEFFETLKEVDVAQVEPMTHVIALENVAREDIGQKSRPELVEKLISMAPASKDGYLKVQEVFSAGKKK